MTEWKGLGYKPLEPATFELRDDEVLTLIRVGTINLPAGSPDQVSAMRVWQRLQRRAEDILNEQRASRR